MYSEEWLDGGVFSPAIFMKSTDDCLDSENQSIIPIALLAHVVY